jgi:hypothetical protein
MGWLLDTNIVSDLVRHPRTSRVRYLSFDPDQVGLQG